MGARSVGFAIRFEQAGKGLLLLHRPQTFPDRHRANQDHPSRSLWNNHADCPVTNLSMEIGDARSGTRMLASGLQRNGPIQPAVGDGCRRGGNHDVAWLSPSGGTSFFEHEPTHRTTRSLCNARDCADLDHIACYAPNSLRRGGRSPGGAASGTCRGSRSTCTPALGIARKSGIADPGK